MARQATGELRPLANGFEARVRIEGKARKGFALLASLSAEDAANRCREMADMAARIRRAGHSADTVKLLEWAARVRPSEWGAVTTAVDSLCGGRAELIDARSKMTFGELANEWTSGRLHAEYPDHVDAKRTSDHDAQRLAKWIFPVAEHIPLHAFTIAHAQDILRRIPAEKSRATRRHVAQLMTRICNLAVYPCEHIDRSPLPRGFLPRIGKSKALAYLYPDEDRRLLACVGTADKPGVPFVERLFYGFLAREGLRSDEAQSLTWGHVDLERGSIRVDVNKTDDPRTWALDPGVVRALEWWKDQQAEPKSVDRVFAGLEKPYHMAMMFRGHLQRAGITRGELFERSESRRPIRIHDLRATMITVNLANGKTESFIADRTGHTTSAMINRYRRASRTHAELGQGTLTPLDAALGLPHQRPMAVASGGTTGHHGSESATESALPVIANHVTAVRIPLGTPSFPVEGPGRGAIMGQTAEGDPIEAALARALEAATAAGRFDVVAQLARELEARRLGREPNVVRLTRPKAAR